MAEVTHEVVAEVVGASTREVPTKCLVEPPSHMYEVELYGVYINLKKLSRLTSRDYTYLSRIFSGYRPLPRVELCQQFAKELGMSTDGFVEALQDRVTRLSRNRLRRARQVWRSQHADTLEQTTR